MNRRTVIFAVFLALLCCSLPAQELPQERVYAATDRDVYICGEDIRCSLYSVDANTGRLSDISAVAYIELQDANGTVARSKAALEGGRGSASVSIPAHLATGNYSLVAYTRSGSGAPCSPHIISIFNVENSARRPGGVKVLDNSDYAAASAHWRTVTDGISMELGESGDSTRVLRLVNHRQDACLLSLSVCREDAILAPQNIGIVDFMAGLHGGAPAHEPEMEGEVIRGSAPGASSAILSTIGDISNIYVAPVASDGSFEFRTFNIFGNKDAMIFTDGGNPASLESGFIGGSSSDIPVLPISSSLENSLLWRRSYAGAGVRYSVGKDPVQPFGEPDRKYLLDDYTRFPSVSETIVEYVTDVSVREDVITVRCDGSLHLGESLVLLDGVPYFDHKAILSLNPRLLKSVEVFNHEIVIGSRTFKGAVNFISFKGRLPKDLPQAGMTRIKFDGVCVPFAESNPDGFTLFWHPLLELGPGQELSVRIPSCPGPSLMVAEGLDTSGHPVCCVLESR